MSLDSVDAVMKKLGVESFDNLSTEQLYELGVELRNVSDDVRKKLIDTVPGLQKLLGDAITAAERVASKSIDARTAEAPHVHAAYTDARRILDGELQRGDLSDERRERLIEEVMKTADKQADFAKANGAAGERTAKAVANTGLNYALLGIATSLLLAGGNLALKRLRF